ncbi:hypothetical protein CHARACLAT_026180 [Characodon lateralis]|uniref:Uncharacterized protein n=1 Tax=Characodon lateralis TaxID=208331 RepID=A0ABU7DUB8_9TELE|nr:hypothetical protein [Characodon lateralis]
MSQLFQAAFNSPGSSPMTALGSVPKAHTQGEPDGTWNLEKLHLELKYLGRKLADAKLQRQKQRSYKGAQGVRAHCKSNDILFPVLFSCSALGGGRTLFLSLPLARFCFCLCFSQNLALHIFQTSKLWICQLVSQRN